MNKKISSLLLLSTVCLAAGLHAGEDYSKSSKNVIQQPPPKEDRFYVSLAAGGEFDMHATKFISNGGGDVGIPGASLPVKVQSRDFTAMHDPGVINGQLEFGYHLNDFLTVFAGFTYSHADGDTHGVGRISDVNGIFGPLGGVYELNAHVSEYEAYTGKAGIKFNLPRTILDFIHAPKIITPYFSAAAGGKYVEAQHAYFFGGGYDSGRVGLYEDSWVFTTQLQFGYDIALARNFSVVIESGYGYDTKPERSDNRLPGVSGVNDGGDRLYSTVSVGAKYKF